MALMKAHATGWKIRGQTLPLGRRTLLMGILNVTPDSFSDAGRFFQSAAAVAHGRKLVSEGADILDVGGESTRPGSEAIAAEEEIRRVVPVIQELRRLVDVPISVDTRKAFVANAAIAAGADIINDVTALRDPDMASVAAQDRVGLVLMHMRGEPRTMQQDIHYGDVVQEVREHLRERALAAESSGVARDAIAVDPGLGFGKRTGKGVEDNATLLRGIPDLAELGYPVLVGASRKSFLGNVLRRPVAERLEGSLAAAAIAAWQGAAVIRAHDVEATRRVLDTVDAIRQS